MTRAVGIGAALACAFASTCAVATGAPTGAGFHLRSGSVNPAVAFFDGRPVSARFAFRAERRLDVALRIVRVDTGRTVRRWVRHGLAPGKAHRLRWDGRRDNRGVPGDGTYELRAGPLGHRGARIGRFAFYDHVFPVAGAHTYGDVFGAPRSGGRVHEGQDLPASCGTPLIAARGGRVQGTGYSDALYGYYVVIDGLATRHDYFYAHLQAPTPLSDGERVRTGEPIGAVGKTGNARTEFCQLHFELWPRGYHDGGPTDPAPALRRWDGFS